MMGRPMLPTAAVLSPAAVRIDSSIWVVVVLPFVPVIPSHGTILSGRLSRQLHLAPDRHATISGLYQQWCAGRPAGRDHQVGVVGKGRSRTRPKPDRAAEHFEQLAPVGGEVIEYVVQSRDAGAEMEQPIGSRETRNADACDHNVGPRPR